MQALGQGEDTCPYCGFDVSGYEEKPNAPVFLRDIHRCDVLGSPEKGSWLDAAETEVFRIPKGKVWGSNPFWRAKKTGSSKGWACLFYT